LLAVEVDSKFQFAIAGVTDWETELHVEGFGDGRADGADPSNGEGLHGGVARLNGIGEGPVKVDFLVDADHGGSAVEVGV
jgi:hypothetical protein